MSDLLKSGPSVEKYTEVIPLPGGDDGVFTNAFPPWEPEPSGGLFGGFLVAHSLAAAHATAPTDFAPHSFQGVFLLPAKSPTKTSSLHYHVERVADGRNFATRIVRLRQGGAQVFIATIGLQKQQAGIPTSPMQMHPPYHQYAAMMPDMGDVDPETLPRGRNQILLDMGWPQRAIDRGVADPFDWRHFSATFGDDSRDASNKQAKEAPVKKEEEEGEPSTFRVRSFVRAVHPIENDCPAAHLRSLAFLTDAYIVGYPTLANAKGMRRRGEKMKMAASVNHTLLLHDATAKADTWMVSEISTSWADHGRALIQQRLWDWKTGKIILTCWQEGLVRLSGPKI